jgi:hypothetical protein
VSDLPAGAIAPVTFDCVLGRCDTMRADVYVRAMLAPTLTHGVLRGTLVGPECRRATTLPATAQVSPVPGEGAPGILLGRAILTEPAFWTPDLPNRFQLTAAVTIAGAEVATCRQMVGLRRFGVRGRSLWLDGRRFVPRGRTLAGGSEQIEAFRRADLTAIVADPSESFLEHCDTEGLAVIAECSSGSKQSLSVDKTARQVVAWARHPAVLVAILPRRMPLDQLRAVLDVTRSSRGTLLLAVAADGGEPPRPVPVGCDVTLLMLPADGLPHSAWRTEDHPLPVIAFRVGLTGESEPSRRPCDELQAALAGWATAAGHEPKHDWAGYIVSQAGLSPAA